VREVDWDERHSTPLVNNSSIPDWITPMAATLTSERFTGPEWTFERKFDGIRLLAFKSGSDVRLYSRTQKPQHLPAIAKAIAALPVTDVVLDGELTWGENQLTYHVFDIVWHDGSDLTGLPHATRRALLNRLPLREPVVHVTEIRDAAPWERACQEGWEGVIAKRRDSPYEQKRSKQWLKMKCELEQDFVVGGFTDPLGSRVGLGALLVGYYRGEDLVFAGKVGTGFDTALLLNLRQRFDASGIDQTPFTVATGLPRVRQHWVRPEVVVRVAFVEWTRYDKLRHSRLIGVRTGRNPRTVVRES
jgi:bifunctional non-homologous end joining protein LigD